MNKKLPVTILDMVIIIIALGLTGFSAFAVYAKPQNTAHVLIQGPTQTWLFPLDADESVSVPGLLGETVIRIRDNQAWVESSPCDNQICVAGGHIHEQGQWVACLPNNVFLIIEGSEGNGLGPDTATW